MDGTIVADDKGYVIETLYRMDTEPILLVSKYRVHVMNGRPSHDRENVRYSSGVWSGVGFQAGTDNQLPESCERLPIKRPRGKKTYRDGEWR